MESHNLIHINAWKQQFIIRNHHDDLTNMDEILFPNFDGISFRIFPCVIYLFSKSSN